MGSGVLLTCSVYSHPSPLFSALCGHTALAIVFHIWVNSLRTDGDFCHQGRDTEIAQNILRLSKPTDMTIHWNALGKHFLMVPFRGINAFSVFSS
jgi:hypothetical protein